MHQSGEAETRTVPGSYFDATYARHEDPWGFGTRWYEERKRALTLAALPRERFDSAFEIGCSIGVLTEELTRRCGQLLSVDISQAAVDRAKSRLSRTSNLTIERADVAEEYPSGPFDLVLLSEVGYYFALDDLHRLIVSIEGSLATNGVLVACHWRHPVDDYPLSGDAVHQAIEEHGGLHRIVRHMEEDFVLEVFSPDPRSVAEQTGLA
ncbi:SAM-dependent methyltransferase [Glaciihabitans sp. UYNi722]